MGVLLKKNIIIVLIIISFFASLFLYIHSRDSLSIKVIGNNNVSIIGDNNSMGAEKIDLNSASQEALESLPGIGKVLAARIIEGRPYDDLWALNRVKGIGPKTIQGLEGKAMASKI